jgi:outer membrane protein assembly factor BamB
MVRELGEAVSCTLLLDDNTLLVGGWDGRIKYWSDEGDVIWEAQTPNRISSMVVQDECIYATSGLHLVCLKQDSGKQVWDMALEGSADAVVSTATCVLAVSSVYDIEHNDFIESAIWAVSFEGKLLQSHRMAERPWTLHAYNDGAIAGLGRPMNGYLFLDENGNIIQQNKDWESPTTCSTDGENPVFGLADGSVRSLDGTLLHSMDSAISNIVAHGGAILLADDRGRLVLLGDSTHWEANGNAVVALSFGFEVNSHTSCWVARWNGSQGALSVRSIEDGVELASLNGHRINDLTFNGNRLAAGFENGQVYVWEIDLFQRRLNQPTQASNDASRSAMFEKLRSLRK